MTERDGVDDIQKQSWESPEDFYEVAVREVIPYFRVRSNFMVPILNEEDYTCHIALMRILH